MTIGPGIGSRPPSPRSLEYEENVSSCFSSLSPSDESYGSGHSQISAMEHEMWMDLGGDEDTWESCRALKDSRGLVGDILPDNVIGFNVSEAMEKFGQMPLPIFDHRLRRGSDADDPAEKPQQQEFREWATYMETLIAPMLSDESRALKRRWIRRTGDDWAGYDLVSLPDEQSAILNGPFHAMLRISSDRARAERQIVLCSRDSFHRQRSRRFVLGIAIADDEMTIVLADRAGVVISEVYSLKERFDVLLRVCMGLLFVDLTRLGYDPAFTSVSGKSLVQISGDQYEVKRGILKDHYLEGSGIRITLLQKDGKEYVMKDVWIERERGSMEADMLRKVTELNIVGTARFVGHDVVHVNGEVDSTEVGRRSWIEEFSPSAYLRRDLVKHHHRMVTTPYGSRLQNFRSLDELVSALKDVTLTIQALDEHGILHRDISTENILLVGSGPESRKGTLIDFEYAVHYDFYEPVRRTNRATGSVPFMSHRVLGLYSPKYYDELESILYVLCWVCSTQAGPNNEVRYFTKAERDCCNGEIGANMRDDDDIEDMARRKYELVKTPEAFEHVLKDFHPYFHPLKPLAEGLRSILLDSRTDPDIGEVGIESLPRGPVFAQFTQEFDKSLDRLKSAKANDSTSVDPRPVLAVITERAGASPPAKESVNPREDLDSEKENHRPISS